jgi:hypothetical protein
MDYLFWYIEYRSCEGNDRWTIARTPIGWDRYDVIDSITLGGCGDDPASISDVYETGDEDYSWDFCII